MQPVPCKSSTEPLNGCNSLQEGYGEFQVCQERGVRADAHRQYLKPVSGRSNLTIVTQARTLGIELEDSRGKPTARGVTFSTTGPDGERHQGGATCLAAPCFRDLM